MRYPLNQPFDVLFTDTVNGVLTDPGTIVLTLQRPDGTQATFASPTHDSTGQYHQTLLATDLAQLGHYQYTWTTTGAGAGVTYGEFDVFDPFEVALLSLQDAKLAINMPATVTTYDAQIQGMVATIESEIERLTGGPVITRQIVERVQVTGYYTTLVLRKRPVVAVQSIVDIASTVSLGLTDLDIDTNSGILRRKLMLPFLSWGPFYTVTYTAGWGTFAPPEINQAARLIFQEYWRAERGPSTMPTMGGGENSQDIRGTQSSKIPDRAMSMLRPFINEAYI